MLQLACAWADAHYLDWGSNEYQPLIQRACAWGGEGTPEVSEYCAAELGALQGTKMAAARVDRGCAGSAISAATVMGRPRSHQPQRCRLATLKAATSRNPRLAGHNADAISPQMSSR
jgi:hypothetical protein